MKGTRPAASDARPTTGPSATASRVLETKSVADEAATADAC